LVWNDQRSNGIKPELRQSQPQRSADKNHRYAVYLEPFINLTTDEAIGKTLPDFRAALDTSLRRTSTAIQSLFVEIPCTERFDKRARVRLLRSLGLNPADGVVRVSLVHYNTVEEIDRLIAVLEPIL